MSTPAEWEAFYEGFCRARYPWLPPAMFGTSPRAGSFFFNGLTIDGKAIFLLDLNYPVQEGVMWHEAGHAVHLVAATRRDLAEGRGTAGEDILNEVSAILTGRSWIEPPDPLRSEYFAEAFRKANTGLTGPAGYPNPPFQVEPYPVVALLNYFGRMNEPRIRQVSVPENLTEPRTRTEEWRGPLPGSNYMPGRERALIDRIVLHHMDGTLAGSHAHFTNPATRVSAHFGVGRDVSVQWVATGDTAYHSGDWQMNLRSIGIEVEDLNRDEYTEAQYLALIKLVKDLAATHGIPLDRNHVLAHRQVTNTECPGTLDVDRIVRDAGGDDMDRETFSQWFLEEYAKVGTAAKFDALAEQIGENTNRLDSKASAKHTHKTGEPEAA